MPGRHPVLRTDGDGSVSIWVWLGAAFVAAGCAGSARAGEVRVEVDGLSDGSGHVRVAACTEAEFMRSCAQTVTVPAVRGHVTAVLRAVPPGRYALQAHHDRDDDGAIGRNLLGMPTEGVGFSRDPSLLLGPPSFDSVALDVTAAPIRVRIGLRFGGSG